MIVDIFAALIDRVAVLEVAKLFDAFQEALREMDHPAGCFGCEVFFVEQQPFKCILRESLNRGLPFPKKNLQVHVCVVVVVFRPNQLLQLSQRQLFLRSSISDG